MMYDVLRYGMAGMTWYGHCLYLARALDVAGVKDIVGYERWDSG